MESINITIEDGNVDIHSNCSQDNFMGAVIIMVSSMAQNSSNTLEELLDIVKDGALVSIENGNLNVQEVEVEEGVFDEV